MRARAGATPRHVNTHPNHQAAGQSEDRPPQQSAHTHPDDADAATHAPGRREAGLGALGGSTLVILTSNIHPNIIPHDKSSTKEKKREKKRKREKEKKRKREKEKK